MGHSLFGKLAGDPLSNSQDLRKLHLEVIREKLENDHGVSVLAGVPAIAYRETISTAAEADHLFRKQNGGVGMYARVMLAVRPNEPGRGFSIESRVSGGNIPVQFMKAVRNGIRDGLRRRAGRLSSRGLAR